MQQLTKQSVDLLVCGGGIYGAWTAYDAALRGLKVALVDKGDWASGTSSASSKLIHGGLRYLENLDFKLVKKSLAERQMLLQTAPHRIWPLHFGLPVYSDSRLNRLALKFGLTLYDCLAGNGLAGQRHRYLDKAAFIDRFPFINTERLLAGFVYQDAQTDDARLVLELIDGCHLAGAITANYCEALSFIENNNHIIGARLRDNTTGEEALVQAKQVVDTTGRWSAQLRQSAMDYRLSKGIHIVMPNAIHQDALLLTAKTDGRVFFALPWYGVTLIGTTDNNYSGDIDHLAINPEEIDYLLAEANHALPETNWTKDDIIGQFAGLRVLQDSDVDSPGTVSRDWKLEIAPNGLLSSIGGKLTSAREDAAVIVDTVCKKLGVANICQTNGKPFPWLDGQDYDLLLKKARNQAQTLGIDWDVAFWLVRRHGKHSLKILEKCRQEPSLCQKIRPELPFIWADLSHCAENEMVVKLEDLLRRRLPLELLAKLSIQEVEGIAEKVGRTLGWDLSKTREEAAHYLQMTRV